MSRSPADTARRHDRLTHVFDERRARLARALVAPPRRSPASGHPLARLQDQGYPLAAGLMLVALLPAVLRFVFRRRKLLLGAATAALRMRKWRKRLAEAQPTGGRP